MTRPRATLLLALGIALWLVANSADFLFRQAYAPVWDSAANGLSILRAKHWAQLYGPYSRWGFYHPGPALFYVQAFGEWLFYDVLHWVRAPFAGQTLAHAAVMSGFFVAALGTFARWTPAGRRRWWFLCGALALAVPHFAGMGRIPSYDVLRGPSAFLSTWSAHALVLPFLCLLAAGASVAAGRGEDLPTLALASGYLLHLHVAQPMFVLPTFALGYAGLLWQVGRRAGTGGDRTRIPAASSSPAARRTATPSPRSPTPWRSSRSPAGGPGPWRPSRGVTTSGPSSSGCEPRASTACWSSPTWSPRACCATGWPTGRRRWGRKSCPARSERRTPGRPSWSGEPGRPSTRAGSLRR